MTHAFRITSEAVKQEQGEMLRIIADADISTNAIADALCVCPSYVRHVRSNKTTTRFTTEQDLMLRSMCAHLGHYEFVERLLGEDALVTRRPSVKLNETTLDDVLNGLEALGPIRGHEKNGEWLAVRQFGAAVKEAGWCIELEAANQMDCLKARPTMALSAPLFETT